MSPNKEYERDYKKMKTLQISDETIRNLKLRGKTKCPACGWPGHYSYEGNIGFTQDKCRKCGTLYIIDEATLQTRVIPKNAS